MKNRLKKLFNCHFEWMALFAGLFLFALMNPYVDQGSSWCLFEWAGVTFCPGEGLGHSIAYTFRGDFSNALQANIMGPFAVIFIAARIGSLLQKTFFRDSYNFKN